MRRQSRSSAAGIRWRRVLTSALPSAALLAALATAPASALGPGDCNNDDVVAIDELATGVGILLGSAPIERCPPIDFDLDGVVGIGDLVRAVRAALDGVSVLKLRGVIEGFYGPPYTFAARRDMVRFLPRAGLNTYVYAPKLDALHRERWRDAYPAEFLDHFRELAEIGDATGVRFVYALAPALGFDPDAGDGARAAEKFGALFDVGVRHFCLLFDDIAEGRAAEPDVQVDLANDLLSFLQDLDPSTTLCFIGNYYAGTTEELANDSSPFEILYPTSSSVYFEAYRRMDARIPILWTGPRVFSDHITLDEARRFRAFADRPVLVWDNYPVNDVVLEREIFLGPYRGRDAGLEDALEGILLNPMLQPEASKIALWTAGRSFALGADYDPELAVRQALRTVGGGDNDALDSIADFFRSHPLIGDQPEAPALATAMGDFLMSGTAASRDVLLAQLDELSDIDRRLDATLANRALAAELAAPAHKISLAAETARLAVELVEGARAGMAVDTAELREKLATLDAIPWLAGANTPLPPALATLLGERPATQADVFGNFFARVLEEIEPAAP